MKPRIGAISGRGCLIVIMSASVLLCSARAAFADEEAGPAPRPQSIPLSPMVLLDDPADEPVVENEAIADEDAHTPPANSQEPTARSLDENVALGMPNVLPRETQSLAGESTEVDSVLGSLDPRNNEVARVVGALAVVIGLMLLLRIAAKKFGGPLLDGGRPSGVLLVLARYPIGRGQSLVLLKLGRRLLLCHQTKGAMATLCEIQSEDEVAAMLARIEAGSRGKDAARFERMLEEFNMEHRRRGNGARRDVSDMRSALAAAPVIDLTKRTPGNGGGAGWLKLRKAAS